MLCFCFCLLACLFVCLVFVFVWVWWCVGYVCVCVGWIGVWVGVCGVCGCVCEWNKSHINCPKTHDFMQPSIGILNSPSSSVVKDSTPSRRRFSKSINFGIGDLHVGSEHGDSLSYNIWSMVNLERKHVKLFYYFINLNVNLDLEKNQLV